uniref:Uncharacterized protein n=1 Tax=Takifugu rubripes TaxID=31033 RepID=A0A3B5JWA1_TAKRU
MSSMDAPFSSRFSMSTSSFTPSTTICTSSTSEKPSLSALEMSNTPPTAAVSTPPDESRTGTHPEPSVHHVSDICKNKLEHRRTSATLLEPQLLENIFKLGMFAHVW